MALSLNTQSFYREVQAVIYATLLSDGSCDGIALREVIDGDITSMIDDALGGILQSAGGKYGLAALVYPPQVIDMMGIGGGRAQPTCSVKIELLNEQLVNFGTTGAAIWPSTAAALILDLLDGREFRWLGVSLRPATTAITQAVVDGSLRHYVTVEFYMARQRGPRVATPVPVATVGEEPMVTLSCATPGAAIYYTTAASGVIPAWPSRSAGSLYTAPFTVNDVTEVAAAAYLEGHPSSETLMFEAAPQLLPHILTEGDAELSTEAGQSITVES